MKKVIGILGVAVFSMTMFFNANTINNANGDLALESLIVLNIAGADVGGGNGILEEVPTNCKCKISGKILGKSNDCTIGSSGCTDNDCSDYDVNDC